MGSQLLSPRINRLEQNILINGGMELSQRGSTGMLSNAYSLDRYYVNNVNTSMTTLIDASSAVPTNMGLIGSMRVYNTTTGSLVAGTQADVRYRVEGYDILPILRDEWTLIFWVRSSVLGTYSISAKNVGTTHSYTRQYTINAINTWELKCIKFPMLSSCPGTIHQTTGVGVELKWSIVTGTTFQTGLLNQWATGNFEAGAGQVTSWLTSGNEFLLTGCMLIPGDWEALNSSGYKFVRSGRNWTEEVMRAQRYYEKSYGLTVNPATVTQSGAFATTAADATEHRNGVMYKTRKRIIPSILIYSPQDGNGARFGEYALNATFVANRVLGTIELNGEGGFCATSSGSQTTGNHIYYHWTSDAEL